MATSNVTANITISSGSEIEPEFESDFQKIEMEVEDTMDSAAKKITFTEDYYKDYLPKSHIKMKKESIIEVNGRLQKLQYEESINDSVLKAASTTVERAIDEQRRWTPEEIGDELLKEEPFLYHDPSYVKKRALLAWNTLNKKYKESVKESKLTGNGVLDKRGLVPNPEMDDWMSRVECIHMLLDGLNASVVVKKKESKGGNYDQKPSRKNKKTRNLLQQSLYAKSVFYDSSQSDSEVNKSPVVKRKRRGITKAKDDEEDSLAKVKKAMERSNRITEEEVARKEMISFTPRVNLGASGSGLNRPSVEPESAVDRRLKNLEEMMAQLHLKLDKLKSKRATDGRSFA